MPQDKLSHAGPLAGVRVLDLTRVFMGPLATQILADQGADVIMVESAGGDTNRVMGPGPHEQLSGVALNLLRNKRSVQVDLKSPAGRAFVHRLAATCDVAVSTMRPDALRRLGIDYSAISAVKPDIIYCQAQGFRLDGPLANEPAYDDIIQAACGVSDIMERVWGAPALLPTILADKVCGLAIAQAVSAALFHHRCTGKGQHIELAMEETISAFMLAEHGAGAIAEPPVAFADTPAAGYPRVLSSERRPHRTKDGQIHLFPYLPKHYAAIFTEAGVPDAEDDPRYATERDSLRNSDELYREVRKIALLRTTDEWLEFCRQAGIPATPVRSLQEMVDVLPLDTHPVAGQYRVLPPFARFSGNSTPVRRHAPLIGEHTDRLLTEIDEGTGNG